MTVHVHAAMAMGRVNLFVFFNGCGCCGLIGRCIFGYGYIIYLFIFWWIQISVLTSRKDWLLTRSWDCVACVNNNYL